MDDNKIIELYFQRDENAIIQTKECYGERLKTLAFRILSNNEAWETIPPNKPQYFFAYLAKICRNTALHILEKAKAEKRNVIVTELTNELSECLPDKKSIEEAAEHELSEAISVFLKTLSKDNRVIFIRRYFMTESVADIAKVLGVSEIKVKSSLFRTRNKLRDYLSKEEFL